MDRVDRLSPGISEPERAIGKTVTCQLFHGEDDTSRRIVCEAPLQYTRYKKKFSQAISSYPRSFAPLYTHGILLRINSQQQNTPERTNELSARTAGVSFKLKRAFRNNSGGICGEEV